jgi:hypothetical protein
MRVSRHKEQINQQGRHNMQRFSLCIFIAQVVFISTVITILPAQAQMLDKDMGGVPFYPGSRQIPNYTSVKADKNPQSFQNINLATSDGFKRVLNFYQEKLGKFSISKSQSVTKSAMWNESTPKGYRIVTLLETEEGTLITITRRVW